MVEHLPEALLSPKVRSTPWVYTSLWLSHSGQQWGHTLASELLASQFSGYLALGKEPDLSKPAPQHRIHELVASPTIKNIVLYVISGRKVLRRSGSLCDCLTTMQTLSAKRFLRGEEGKEEVQADTRGPLGVQMVGGVTQKTEERGLLKDLRITLQVPCPRIRAKTGLSFGNT